MTTNEAKNRLAERIAALPGVLGVGQTGDPAEPLIPGQSDVDLFVLCDPVPDRAAREALYQAFGSYSSLWMEASQGGLWGFGDILVFGGVDVMFMFFPVQEMRDYVARVLAGELLDRDGRFYPTGRLATVQGMHVLRDEAGAWAALQAQVNAAPDALFARLYQFHLERVLDEEDLGRSVLRRDALFFHQVLENALDHYLQALYALNRAFFPSRKRAEQYLRGFAHKPEDCWPRLLRLLQKGAAGDTVPEAVSDLCALTAELIALGEANPLRAD